VRREELIETRNDAEDSDTEVSRRQIRKKEVDVVACFAMTYDDADDEQISYKTSTQFIAQNMSINASYLVALSSDVGLL